MSAVPPALTTEAQAQPAAASQPFDASPLVTVAVDVYPYEGGKVALHQAQLLSMTTSKGLYAADSGAFALQIAPGGPNGPDRAPTWIEVITPMSLVVIGIRRGPYQRVVMVGVVTRAYETQAWTHGQAVARAMVLEGRDFTYYFNIPSYFAQTYMAMLGVGEIPIGPVPYYAQVLAAGYLTGNPGDIGAAFLTGGGAGPGIMAGASGVMAGTSVAYRDARVTFNQALTALLERYDVYVPNAQYLISVDGTWLDKFRLIFPHPWYEFFVVTADPGGAYVDPLADYALDQQGLAFSTGALGSGVVGGPTVVARPLPLPTLTAAYSGDLINFTGIDSDRWNRLSIAGIDKNLGFLQSSVGFDLTDVRNYYQLNPTWAGANFGQAPGSIQMAAMTLPIAGDKASVQRYGFSPANTAFDWLCDPAGQFATQAAAKNLDQGTPITDMLQLSATILARYCSWYEPLPLMAKGQVTIWLRPDILPGTRFRYRPFKGDATWDFYVTGVEHAYAMGGPSVTRLTLERGLPTSVYADTGSGGLLFAVHTGNAQRVNGVYTSGLVAGSASGLGGLNQSVFSQFVAGAAQSWSSPQTP